MTKLDTSLASFADDVIAQLDGEIGAVLAGKGREWQRGFLEGAQFGFERGIGCMVELLAGQRLATIDEGEMQETA